MEKLLFLFAVFLAVCAVPCQATMSSPDQVLLTVGPGGQCMECHSPVRGIHTEIAQAQCGSCHVAVSALLQPVEAVFQNSAKIISPTVHTAECLSPFTVAVAREVEIIVIKDNPASAANIVMIRAEWTAPVRYNVIKPNLATPASRSNRVIFV